MAYFNNRLCIDCGVPLVGRIGNARLCVPCARERQKEHRRKWDKANKKLLAANRRERWKREKETTHIPAMLANQEKYRLLMEERARKNIRVHSTVYDVDMDKALEQHTEDITGVNEKYNEE